jgi:hypothetical protein
LSFLDDAPLRQHVAVRAMLAHAADGVSKYVRFCYSALDRTTFDCL